MADVEPERVLAHYRLGALIARGATGAVYRATESASGRTVALKLVEHGNVRGVRACDEHRARLGRYVERMRKVRHPSIVAVLDAGCAGAVDYIAMELARGRDLTAYIYRGRLLPLERTLEIAAQLAFALSHAHAQGVLHGDVKAANVLYEASSSTAKLVDFALALAFDSQPGTTPGTPIYLAPERLCGGGALPASDQFSLAVLLYRLVCGELPFDGSTRPEIVWNMVHGRARRLPEHRGRSPGGLSALLQKALRSDPRERHADIGEMAHAIRAVLEQLRKPSLRRARALASPRAISVSVS
jgi:eukaryotic-like serine/threonine-protein kinase